MGIRVSILHGGLTQGQRNNAMKSFIRGEELALIATDVAARGIDIQNVKSVIHYDPPENSKAYKHRSGRTARAGDKGVVISLVQKPQKRSLTRIQKEVGINEKFLPPDFEILPKSDFKFKRAPTRRRKQERVKTSRNNNGRRNRRGSNNDNRGRGRGRSRNQRDSRRRTNSKSDNYRQNKSQRNSSRKTSNSRTNTRNGSKNNTRNRRR